MSCQPSTFAIDFRLIDLRPLLSISVLSTFDLYQPKTLPSALRPATIKALPCIPSTCDKPRTVLSSLFNSPWVPPADSGFLNPPPLASSDLCPVLHFSSSQTFHLTNHHIFICVSALITLIECSRHVEVVTMFVFMIYGLHM